MDAVDADELRALRARAYGPDADIAEDPAAIRRLRELESRAGAPASADDGPHGDDAGPAEADEEARAGSRDPVPAPGGGDSRPAEDTGRAPRSRRRLGIAALCVLSVVAAAAITGVVTFAFASGSDAPSSGEGRRIAVLEASTVRNLPVEWFGTSSSSLVFHFHGLTFFTTDSGIAAGANCFMGLPTRDVPSAEADAQSWAAVGVLFSGCRAGAFPATVQTIVEEGSPDELRAAFPQGSALKFVLDGDRIGVYSSDG